MGFIFAWVVMAVIVGIAASGRGRNPFVYFAASLFLSPIIAIIFLYMGANLVEEAEKEKLRKEDQERQLESIKAIASRNESPSSSHSSVADELKKLAELRDTNVLTEEEFQAQKNQLLKSV